MKDNSWKHNNLLYLTEAEWSTKYHYWQDRVSYRDLISMLNNPVGLYNYVFRYVNLNDNSFNGKNNQPVRNEQELLDRRTKNDLRNFQLTAREVLTHGSNSPIDIYRGVILTKNSEFDEEDFGVCWAWDMDGVIYFLPYNPTITDEPWNSFRCVLLHGKVDRDNIDWAESIYLHQRYWDEHELRVIDPRRIKLVDKQVSDSMYEVEQLRPWLNKFK